MLHPSDFESLLFVDIDECTIENQAQRHQCFQDCVNTEGSYMCQCRNGYRLAADGRSCEGIFVLSHTMIVVVNNYHCYTHTHTHIYIYIYIYIYIDIDECSETSSSCSQVCINTEGSFMCECHTGFVLGNDSRTCVMGMF